MKRFTQFVCLLLILSTVLVMPADAGTRSIEESNYFGAELAYLVVTGTDVEVWIEVDAVGIMDELGAKSITVQRSSDKKNWTDMKTYTKEDYPELVTTDAIWHDAHVPYSATSGYYYRAKVWFYAKKGNGTGTVSYYTDAEYI